MNTRSIVSKLSKFHSLIYSKDCDIIAITETLLSDNLLNQEIIPTSYSVYRKDQSYRGGVMMLAVKHSVPSHTLGTPTELEALCVQIGKNDSVTICLVYIPPHSSEMYIQSLCDCINTTVSHSDKCIIYN